MEEKYRLCDETLSKLLEWIAVVEERLANQEAVKEDIDELRNQINILKVRLLKSSFSLKIYWISKLYQDHRGIIIICVKTVVNCYVYLYI